MSDTVRSGAAFARGASKQDYATPWELIDAIESRAGSPLAFDLAAHQDNVRVRKAPMRYFGPGSTYGEDSLASDLSWASIVSPIDLRRHAENLWLNPPFDTIAPWARKCAESVDSLQLVSARIFFLVPASVGSEWWASYVHQKAHVLFLRPRLSFDGKNPYPKDCALCVYADRPSKEWYECWRWC